MSSVCGALQASESSNSIVPYTLRIWQTDDGLPQNSVYAIAQSRDGYLWVGTHEGLARFDGVRFSVVDEAAAPELKHGWITALCAGSDGSLWIAVDGIGVTRLKGGVISHLTEADGLVNNQTRCLIESRDGSIWIGTEGGISRFKDGKLTNFAEKTGLGDNSVRALCEDHVGNIRIATRRGLSSLNRDGVISTLNIGIGTVYNALKCVCEDREGNIWAGSNEGLNLLAGDTRGRFGPGEGLPDKITTALYEDRAGQLWVGTYNGLALIVHGKIVPRPLGDASFSDRVYAIFQDREDNLWVGTWDGLYRLTPARFITLTTQQGLSFNNVMSVCEDKTGAIVVGTWGGGVDRLLGDKVSVYTSTNGLSHDSVLSLLEGRDGSLWVGMDFDGGLNHLNNSYSNTFPRHPGLINAAIRVIHEDSHGHLWIGTSRGLNIFKDGKFTTYTTGRGLAGNLIMAICEDKQGTCWIGTDTGLSRWDGGKFINFTTHEGLSNDGINALYPDKEGNLWIGTRAGGLNRYKDGKFSSYTAKDGLFSDEIYEIVEDDSGYFWMSCRTGIFRVSKRDLDAFDRHSVKTIACTAFGRSDGMLSVQCNGVAKPAGWKARDGRIWFPTIRGVVAAQSRIKINDRPPPVVIEDIVVDNTSRNRSSAGSQAVKWIEPESDGRPLIIPPGHGILEIHYTALSFQAPEKNRFKYRLEGLDSSWVDAGNRRIAYYNNLAPGSYHFRVIACNNDGVWNDTGAALALVLLPHYWQTWWFKFVLAASLALVLTALYRSRVARLREIERLRVQIAADLHDDVGARLTKVGMVTEFVDRETPPGDKAKSHIQNIAETTREVIRAMDEIVWTINPKNDTLENLANYMFQYIQDYFQNTGVRCRLDFPASLPEHSISTEERHNLFMAVKEALNNVLKHARASEVRIGLAVADSTISITISDNGAGFETASAKPTGNGLDNMKQRLQRIGGSLILESKPGTGTKVRMDAPWK